MRTCFREEGEVGENISNPAWRKSPSRIFLQMIYAYFSKINGEDGNNAPLFTKSEFHKAMERYVLGTMQHSLSQADDKIIVWASLNNKQYHMIGLCLSVNLVEQQLMIPLPASDEAMQEATSDVIDTEFAPYHTI
jgi:hypothetical protein